MQYYCTSNDEIIIKEEQSPFIFPSCSQILAYLQWWKAQKKAIIHKRRKKIYKDRQSYTTLHFLNILQKSYVSYFELYNVEQTFFI